MRVLGKDVLSIKFSVPGRHFYWKIVQFSTQFRTGYTSESVVA